MTPLRRPRKWSPTVAYLRAELTLSSCAMRLRELGDIDGSARAWKSAIELEGVRLGRFRAARRR